jgi:hypothetical protein
LGGFSVPHEAATNSSIAQTVIPTFFIAMISLTVVPPSILPEVSRNPLLIARQRAAALRRPIPPHPRPSKSKVCAGLSAQYLLRLELEFKELAVSDAQNGAGEATLGLL